MIDSLVDADMRGIRALRDKATDTVLVWYEQVVRDLNFDPATPAPVVEEPEPWVWEYDEPIHDLILALARDVAAPGVDVADVLFQEQCLAWYLKRRQEAGDGDDDSGEAEQSGRGGSAAAQRGSADFPGGSEDGDAVGEGRVDSGGEDEGASSQVPRRGRARKIKVRR